MTLIRMSLFLWAAVAAAERSGHATGNGGQSAAQEFVSMGYELAEWLPSRPVEGVDAAAFRRVVETTRVTTQAQLALNGALVDAINYPDANEPRIELSLNGWERMQGGRHQRVLLAFHEYLGILGVDDSRYQVSSKLDRERACSRLPDVRAAIELYLGKPCYALDAQDLAQAEAGLRAQFGDRILSRDESASDNPTGSAFYWATPELEKVHQSLLVPYPAYCGIRGASSLASAEKRMELGGGRLLNVVVTQNTTLPLGVTVRATFVQPGRGRTIWTIEADTMTPGPTSCAARSRIRSMLVATENGDGLNDEIDVAMRGSRYWSAAFWERVRAGFAGAAPLRTFTNADFFALWKDTRGLPPDPHETFTERLIDFLDYLATLNPNVASTHEKSIVWGDLLQWIEYQLGPRIGALDTLTRRRVELAWAAMAAENWAEYPVSDWVKQWMPETTEFQSVLVFDATDGIIERFLRDQPKDLRLTDDVMARLRAKLAQPASTEELLRMLHVIGLVDLSPLPATAIGEDFDRILSLVDNTETREAALRALTGYLENEPRAVATLAEFLRNPNAAETILVALERVQTSAPGLQGAVVALFPSEPEKCRDALVAMRPLTSETIAEVDRYAALGIPEARQLSLYLRGNNP